MKWGRGARKLDKMWFCKAAKVLNAEVEIHTPASAVPFEDDLSSISARPHSFPLQLNFILVVWLQQQSKPKWPRKTPRMWELEGLRWTKQHAWWKSRAYRSSFDQRMLDRSGKRENLIHIGCSFWCCRFHRFHRPPSNCRRIIFVATWVDILIA